MEKNFRTSNYIDLCFISIHKGELCLLITKRSKEPYTGAWSLPGGIWESHLTPDEASNQVMYRKTGLRNVYLEQLKTYGGMGRDPRGASCSIAYIGLINYDKLNKSIVNSDGEEFQWVPLNIIPQLAFDHNKIVDDAKQRIVNKIRYTKVGFELVGEEFTLKELVCTFEKIIGKKIDQSNLRKKLTEKLQIIKEVRVSKLNFKSSKGRSGIVYKLDLIEFEKMPIDESFF